MNIQNIQEFTALETQKPFYVRFSLRKTCQHLLRIIDRPFFLENTPTADNLITVLWSGFFLYAEHTYTTSPLITKTINVLNHS